MAKAKKLTADHNMTLAEKAGLAEQVQQLCAQFQAISGELGVAKHELQTIEHALRKAICNAQLEMVCETPAFADET